MATPRPRPTLEYVKDIIAATMESHQTWSKSGIWENMISMIPKVIMYPLLDMWQGSFPPLLWKQFDLFIALIMNRQVHIVMNSCRKHNTPTENSLWKLTSCWLMLQLCTQLQRQTSSSTESTHMPAPSSLLQPKWRSTITIKTTKITWVWVSDHDENYYTHLS